MSNFEAWRAAKAAHELADRAYNAARSAVIDAGNKRSEAWEALVQAAYKLSRDEQDQASDFQYGPSNTSGIREGKS